MTAKYEVCGNYIRTPLIEGGFIVAEFPLTSPTWRQDIEVCLTALNAQGVETK